MGEGLIATLKRFWPYIIKHKTKFFIAIIGMIMAAIGTSASAYVVKPILDDIFINKDEQMLKLLPPLVIFLYFLKGFGKFIQVYYTEYIGQDVIRAVRERMLASILAMQMGYFVQQPSGELISRLTNDINRIKNVVANMIPSFIRELLTIFALTFVVIYQSPKLALYFLFIMPLAIYPLSRLAKRMKKISHASQEKISDLTTHLTEIFNNIELIKAEAREPQELKRFQKHNQDFFELTIKQVRTQEIISPLMEVLGAVIVSLVIFIGGQEVIEGKMTTGEFFSFMTALFMLYTPIKHTSKLYNQIQDAVAAAERIFQIIELTPTIKSGTKAVPANIEKICFEDVDLAYEDKKVLQNISFCAHKDAITAIVGDSGSGKSSLINLIVRFYDPQRGKVTINGKDIKSFDLKSLRNSIALVTQRIYLFQDSIAVNIGGEDYDEARVIDALKKAKAYDFVHALPQGIHTKLTEAAMNLSGGQRQRLAIARALYKDPKILIFDEATSALDKRSEAQILQTIKELAQGRIILLISHNIRSITFANNIVVLQNGKKVCEGDHANLLATCSIYKELYNKN
ncbi:ATP-binding cassette, subfamily B, bacterial MsbA [Nitratiruptor sp. YY08-26]|uniref:ABC transporter ATP-binding protein n=1 Tax=unclassified Nitratiruptor TaxID=2624044 RepID=UPI0019374CBB|nr:MULTISPECIES: ABC transporter ATP-binding protein [unclassified Nitratiruptor]BCD62478.1 ATP-binding cassette, subfamily B, bacterial MsbA [Nitratiruptor sp. YY08-13]BCD66414.1 ATP-binding cassette, subfamily B, bacterial MsbA [Nitratiruptor sp. YY08-26]